MYHECGLQNKPGTLELGLKMAPQQWNLEFKLSIWRFQCGGSRGGPRDACPPLGPNCFIFIQFSRKNWQIIGLCPHLGNWRPPSPNVGNPGSATGFHWGRRMGNLGNPSQPNLRYKLSVKSFYWAKEDGRGGGGKGVNCPCQIWISRCPWWAGFNLTQHKEKPSWPNLKSKLSMRSCYFRRKEKTIQLTKYDIQRKSFPVQCGNKL